LIKEKLKIPQHVQIEAILPIGYAKGKAPKKSKLNLDEALFWENWGSPRRPSVFEESVEEIRPTS